MITKGVHALGRRVATQAKSLRRYGSVKGTTRSLLRIVFERCVLLVFSVELNYGPFFRNIEPRLSIAPRRSARRVAHNLKGLRQSACRSPLSSIKQSYTHRFRSC